MKETTPILYIRHKPPFFEAIRNNCLKKRNQTWNKQNIYNANKLTHFNFYSHDSILTIEK
jgi:hypothetical protein